MNPEKSKIALKYTETERIESFINLFESEKIYLHLCFYGTIIGTIFMAPISKEV
jgi:hypothetical protein